MSLEKSDQDESNFYLRVSLDSTVQWWIHRQTCSHWRQLTPTNHWPASAATCMWARPTTPPSPSCPPFAPGVLTRPVGRNYSARQPDCLPVVAGLLSDCSVVGWSWLSHMERIDQSLKTNPSYDRNRTRLYTLWTSRSTTQTSVVSRAACNLRWGSADCAYLFSICLHEWFPQRSTSIRYYCRWVLGWY